MIIKQIELIRKKVFIVAILNLKNEAFTVYIASIDQNSDVYTSFKTQIVFLKANKISIFVLSEYADFTDIFYKDLVAKLLKYPKINNHVINPIDNKHLLYKLIYCLN